MMMVMMLPFPSFLFRFLFCDALRLTVVHSVCAVPLVERARGFKHNLTPSKGQFSHSAWPWALGTKAPQFTSFNWALAFVPAERGAWSGRTSDQPLLECAVRGS